MVVTLRPLGRILPSQWQQNVQAGMTQAYDAWLGQVFGDRPGRARDAFWQLHRHDQLIERWAAVLGPERVTAVVVDERDHAMLLRVFEGLLGLRDGTLVAERDLSNRSMTLAEVEAVRAFNVAAKQAGVARAVQAKTMRYGAAIHMKQREPGPDEARIDTPGWALDRAREVDEEMVAGDRGNRGAGRRQPGRARRARSPAARLARLPRDRSWSPPASPPRWPSASSSRAASPGRTERPQAPAPSGWSPSRSRACPRCSSRRSWSGGPGAR